MACGGRDSRRRAVSYYFASPAGACWETEVAEIGGAVEVEEEETTPLTCVEVDRTRPECDRGWTSSQLDLTPCGRQ